MVSSVTCLYVLPYKCCQHVIMCHPCYSFNWTSVSWNGQLVLPFCCPQMHGVIIASRQDPKLKNIHYLFKGNYLCQQTVSHLTYMNNNSCCCCHHYLPCACTRAHACTHTLWHDSESRNRGAKNRQLSLGNSTMNRFPQQQMNMQQRKNHGKDVFYTARINEVNSQSEVRGWSRWLESWVALSDAATK